MISVIIPTYNRAALIARAIDSVINQSYKDIEILVIDDASTDNTEEIVKSIPDTRLRYIKLNINSGACHARNVGIEEASGQYIAFLDSDDEWFENKLEKQLTFLQKNNCQIVSCNYFYEKDGNPRKKIPEQHERIFAMEELIYENKVTTGAILVKRDLLVSVGKFDEFMPRYQDWELILRIGKVVDIYYMSECLLTLHFQSSSISSSTSMEKKMYAIERMLSKHRDIIVPVKKGYAHFCWSLGMYSLFTDKPQYKKLREGIFENGLDIRRLGIYLAIRLGGANHVKQKYAVNH